MSYIVESMNSETGKSLQPNFFIIGAPKSGTTALFDYLSRHPQVYCPSQKEFHHFCDDFFKTHYSDAEYVRQFDGIGAGHKASGDGSVLYLYSEAALPRIREFNPAAKIIVMLRNPVDLVYSWHSQLLHNLNENETDFDTAWSLCESRALGQNIPSDCDEPFALRYDEIGRLGKYLERVYQVFPPEQVLVLFLDDMKDDVSALYSRTLDFLDLDPFELPEYKVVNPNSAIRSKWLMRLQKMQPKGAARRFVSMFKRVFGLKHVSIKYLVHKLNSKDVDRVAMSPARKAELTAYFAEDIRLLEKLTGRDLSGWLE